MKHVMTMSKDVPLAGDACCDCQERKAEKGKAANVWDKCEKLGVCEGASYVCVDR